MSDELPAGLIADNAILYGDLPNVSLVVGVELNIPALGDTNDEVKIEFYKKWESFCGSLSENYSVQVKLTVDDDYEHQLSYYRENEGKCKIDKHARTTVLNDFSQSLIDESLWNRKVQVYCSEILVVKGSEKQITARIQASSKAMKNVLKSIVGSVEEFGGAGAEMSDLMLKKAIHNTLSKRPFNSDLNDYEEDDFLHHVYPSASITAEDGVLVHDNLYHKFLTVRETPVESFAFMCNHMPSLSHKNFEIITHVGSTSKEAMVQEMEKRLKIGRKDNEKESSIALDDDLDQLEESIRGIKNQSGGVCKIAHTIHLWSSDKEVLNSYLNEIYKNYANLRGLTLWQGSLAMEIRRSFFACLPGFKPNGLDKFEHEVDPVLASRMLPLSSNFKGDIYKPDCLYQGDSGSIVGFNLFRGGKPLHTCVFGGSGTGKSAFCNDLLLQINNQVSQTLIIETGNSYGVTVAALGAKTLDLKVNGNHRMNLFDTYGMPLMSEKIATITIILNAMCGLEDETIKAAITNSVDKFMNLAREQFIDENPWAEDQANREAFLFHLFKLDLSESMDDSEAFASFKKEVKESDLEEVSETDLLNFIQNPQNEMFVNRYHYSLMKSEDFQVLQDFADYLDHYNSGDDYETELKKSALQLRAWCGGQFGNLLNGHSNFNLDDSLVHIELSGLGENPKLKNVVLTLIQTIAYQKAIASPRSEKKLWIFEEMGSLSDKISGLVEMAKTIARTGRKYNICLLTIVQEFHAFLENKGMKETILGNSDQTVIFKMASSSDVQKLLVEKNLPESLKETIMSFVKPADILPPERPYGTALFASEDRNGTNIGTMYIVCGKAVLWAADSSGEKYDQKMKDIEERGLDAVLEEVMIEDRRNYVEAY